jgi:hypothetical protein
VDERAALIDDGALDSRMTVSQRVDADAAQQVEIAVAFLIDEVHTLASHEEKGIAVIGLKQEPRFGGLDLLEFRQFNIS